MSKHLVYGVGFYTKFDSERLTGVPKSIQYKIWYGMLQRCYDPIKQKNNPRYIGVTVNPTWHFFENFVNWFDDQIIADQTYELDKDLLGRDKKEYGPATCVMLPRHINLTLAEKEPAAGMPRGVINARGNGKYTTRLRRYGEVHHLGTFDDPWMAFAIYKKAKENYLNELAYADKEYLSWNALNGILNYSVRP